jgi:UDP-N-acetylmuramoyl-L-alanyl-D-glutamate--2,6-diaminopimelate ligase
MDLQALLARMLAAGSTHCVLEATSHGLAQQRVAACEFDIGVVTNITHEHLDFHGSYEAYREAKGKLFRELLDTARKPNGPEKLAVLNSDDQSFDYLSQVTRVRRSTYGFDAGADFAGSELAAGTGGIEFRLRARGGELGVRSPLLGAYNASNVLAALAATVDGLGVDLQLAVETVGNFAGVPGRMEVIDLGQPFQALVDFAHTPNALRQALLAARTLTPGRVIAVFGSAGLRDRAKRRMMAELSVELADLTVLTAEDPRTESLEGILAEMAAGALAKNGEEGATFWRVPDRGEALRFAIRMARPGDLVLACGKGHEQSMCFGETEHPWDDRVAMRAALAELLGIEGPPMPWLPTRGA